MPHVLSGLRWCLYLDDWEYFNHHMFVPCSCCYSAFCSFRIFSAKHEKKNRLCSLSCTLVALPNLRNYLQRHWLPINFRLYLQQLSSGGKKIRCWMENVLSNCLRKQLICWDLNLPLRKGLYTRWYALFLSIWRMCLLVLVQIEARSQATFNRFLRAGTVLKNYHQGNFFQMIK